MGVHKYKGWGSKYFELYGGGVQICGDRPCMGYLLHIWWHASVATSTTRTSRPWATEEVPLELAALWPTLRENGCGLHFSLDGAGPLPLEPVRKDDGPRPERALSPSTVHVRKESKSGKAPLSPSGMATVPDSLTKMIVWGIRRKVLAMLHTVIWSLRSCRVRPSKVKSI